MVRSALHSFRILISLPLQAARRAQATSSPPRYGLAGPQRRRVCQAGRGAGGAGDLFSRALVSLRCCKVDGLHKNVSGDGRGMPRRAAPIYTCPAACPGQLTFKPRRSGTRDGIPTTPGGHACPRLLHARARQRRRINKGAGGWQE